RVYNRCVSEIPQRTALEAALQHTQTYLTFRIMTTLGVMALGFLLLWISFFLLYSMILILFVTIGGLIGEGAFAVVYAISILSWMVFGLRLVLRATYRTWRRLAAEYLAPP